MVGQDMVKVTKEIILRDMKNVQFDLSERQIHPQKWQAFKENLMNHALVLLRDINRMKDIYTRISVEDIAVDFQSDEKYHYFDFVGSSGSVRFVFRKGNGNRMIQFDRLEEKIFEEVYSLF